MYELRWDAPRETAHPSTFLIDLQDVIFFSKIVKAWRKHFGRGNPWRTAETNLRN
jgi:hypothetical protein